MGIISNYLISSGSKAISDRLRPKPKPSTGLTSPSGASMPVPKIAAPTPMDLNKTLASGGLTYNSGPAIPYKSAPARPPQERVAAASVVPSSGPAAPKPTVTSQGGFSAPQGSDLASRVAAMGKAAEGAPPPPPPVTPSPINIASAPDASAPPARNSQLDALRSRYVSSFAPTEEERGLSRQLIDLQGATAMGVSGLEGQGRGIPLELVRGQQSKLQEQGQLQQQTLQQQIANVMAERTLSQQATQAELGFAEKDIAKEEARQAAQSAGVKPIEIGGSLVALNPQTGQYEVVYQAPVETPEFKPFGVSPGETVIDPNTGEVIYQAPFRAAASGGGGGGSGGGYGGGGTAGLSSLAKSIAENPGLMANLTPTEKGKVLRELSAAGADLSAFGLADLNAGQREKISLFDTLMGTASGAKALIEQGVDTGPISSRLQSAGRAVFGGGAKFGELGSLVANMNTTLLNLRSGAAVTPQEFERLSAFIPNVNDQESVIKQKIDSFNSELEAAKNNFIGRATQSVAEIAGYNQSAPTQDFRAKYKY